MEVATLILYYTFYLQPFLVIVSSLLLTSYTMYISINSIQNTTFSDKAKIGVFPTGKYLKLKSPSIALQIHLHTIEISSQSCDVDFTTVEVVVYACGC